MCYFELQNLDQQRHFLYGPIHLIGTREHFVRTKRTLTTCWLSFAILWIVSGRKGFSLMDGTAMLI